MAPPRVLLLSGPIGAGKDHVAALLGARAGYRRVALADALKDAAAERYGVERATFDLREAKDRPVLPDGRTPRDLLVELAARERAADPDVFVRRAVDAARAAVADGGRVVVSDARLAREVAAFRRAFSAPGECAHAWVERTDGYERVVDAVLELSKEGADAVLLNPGPDEPRGLDAALDALLGDRGA